MRCSELDTKGVPYVDGEMPSPERAEIDQHLDRCPPCRERIEAERAARDALRAQRQRLCEPAPDALRARCRQTIHATIPPVVAPHRPARRLPLSLAAAALLAIAVLWTGRIDAGTSVLAAQVTLDHLKCAKFDSPRVSGSPATLSDRWREMSGWPIVVPAAAGIRDLRLSGIRRCASSEGQTAHIMYSYHGRPLSLFIARDDTARTAREFDLFGHQAVVWSSDHRTYLLVGNEPREAMQALAAVIRKETSHP
jgi:mycothiol system anti-sigma-R factor